MKANSIPMLVLFYLITNFTFAQVGIGTTNPDPSSILNLESNSAGLLITRLSETQKNGISNPATGLLIYQTNNESGFWYYTGSTWVPFATKYTFTNGLNETNNLAKLGGDLTENTTITLNNNDLTFQATDFFYNLNFEAPVGVAGANTATVTYDYSGDLIGIGATRDHIFMSDYSDDVLRVGHQYGGLLDDGTAFNINGDVGNLDYVVKFYDGANSRGTTMGIGSIEYLVDGESILGSSVSFVPLNDGFDTLGTSLNRWDAVYAVNGTIQTSDATLKQDIIAINYGLEEIMKLKPVTYKWKNNRRGTTIIPEELKEIKIGFLAQEVQEIIPEVVQTHQWKVLDEKNPRKYSYVQNDRLGMNYSEIIPVLVKAIQEQQKQIEDLKKNR